MGAKTRYPRYLLPTLEEDLSRKMVFLGGPRQVGKTSLGRELIPNPSAYLNWDFAAHRAAILKHQLPAGDAWFFDEIHKYRHWRGFLKGLFDIHGDARRILVTGSARLDYYRYGGDSLQGRYHYLRLHPFSVAELGIKSQSDFEQLLRLGGFPDPFFSGSERQARRWARDYRDRLMREEVVSLERIDDLGQLELLVMRLPGLVGSPLSLNGLREDLSLSHRMVSGWIEVLERLYSIYRIAPFGAPRIRAVKKAQKHYHFDWSVVEEEGARFENLVASHLLKWVHWQSDVEGRDAELRYFRDTDGREVDFVVMVARQPVSFIECKMGDGPVGAGIRYLKQRFPQVDAWQVAARTTRDYVTREGVRVAPVLRLLEALK
ncbi:MAG: ATP-binding protein [Betaproteobacteria bacterium]|nr:ATP-binding protein [Betaproteobacteria bacterium]